MNVRWQERRIGEILQLQYGKPLNELDRNPSGQFPVYGANGEKHRTDKFYHAKASIIVGRKGSAGELNLTEGKFWPLDVTYFVTFDEKQQDLRFIYYLLTTLELTKLAKGVKPGINRNDVYSKVVRVPPLPEQKRIAAILDEAFKGIGVAKANAEKNLKNAKAIFDSHLDSVFTQTGDNWVDKSVGELVAEGTLAKPFDGNHGEIHPRKADFKKAGVPFVMASDLHDGEVDFQHCAFLSRRHADSLRVGFSKDGDVLISHKGTIGRSAIVKTTDEYIMLTPQVTAYRVINSDKLYNRFIRYCFMSPAFQKTMIAGAADGSTRAYIGITKQLWLRLHFPPVAEQMRIAAQLDVLLVETQRLAEIYEQKIIALEALKKSLLHSAFAGDLAANKANGSAEAVA